MNWQMLHPNYAVEIKTPEQARLYNRLLVAKIVVQLLVICGLLAIGGTNWAVLAVVIGVATVWQVALHFARKSKQKQTQ